MRIVKKWRDAKTEVNEIPFNDLKVDEVLSYPHCCNDVYVVKGKRKKSKRNSKYVIKVERGTFARFDIEAKRLKSNDFKNIPIATVIEDGTINDKNYVVMKYINGERLSEMKKEKNPHFDEALFNAGKILKKIHSIKPSSDDEAIKRKINDYPEIREDKEYDEYSLEIIDYLKQSKPEMNNNTFIHGDYHYGNLLFKDEKLTAVLDLELSGMGYKEQDLAWALILRPTQRFFNKIYQIKEFLNGYGNDYDREAFKWTYINGSIHFYLMNIHNERYKRELRQLITWCMNDKF